MENITIRGGTADMETTGCGNRFLGHGVDRPFDPPSNDISHSGYCAEEAKKADRCDAVFEEFETHVLVKYARLELRSGMTIEFKDCTFLKSAPGESITVQKDALACAKCLADEVHEAVSPDDCSLRMAGSGSSVKPAPVEGAA
jgi:hypothetical protein